MSCYHLLLSRWTCRSVHEKARFALAKRAGRFIESFTA
jgi:hypothetical protein